MTQSNVCSQLKLSVILPSLNEEAAIASVISEIRICLPQAEIYLFDNDSDDNTANIAREMGVRVFVETQRGKGNVVRRMFADVDADIYVMIDADGTYDLSSIQQLLDLVVKENADMVVGTRMAQYDKSDSPAGHRFGNWMLTSLLNVFFNVNLKDILSGYRVFSRRFVKTAPILAKGFEIETVLTVHALESRAVIREVPINYRSRIEGGESKLNTIRDGIRIFSTLFFLIKNVRPLLFFSIVATILTLIGIALGTPLIDEYFRTGLVPRFPTAILATGLMVLAAISTVAGLVLDAIAAERRSAKRLAYLSLSAPSNTFKIES